MIIKYSILVNLKQLFQMITYVPVSPANFTLRVRSNLNFSYNYFRFSKFYYPTQIQRHSNWGFLLILTQNFYAVQLLRMVGEVGKEKTLVTFVEPIP